MSSDAESPHRPLPEFQACAADVPPGTPFRFDDATTVLAAVAGQPDHRGWPVTAWLVIIGITLAVMWLQSRRGTDDSQQGESPIADRVLEMQAKYTVGAAALNSASGNPMYEQAKSLNAGPVMHRLRFVVLAGELVDAKEALSQLSQLEALLQQHQRTPTESESESIQALRHLYTRYEQGQWSNGLPLNQSTMLRARLGWFGDLALAPKAGDSAARDAILGPARQTFAVIITAVIAGFGLLALGFFGLLAGILFWSLGIWRSGLKLGRRWGGMYVETFAVFLVLTVILELAARFAMPMTGLLPALLAVSALSMLALLWPVMRGVPWSELRQDIGLVPGRHPVVEIIIGFGAWIATLPLLLVSLFFVFLLMTFWNGMAAEDLDPFLAPDIPSHPAVLWVADGSWLDRVLILLLASVAAPITEELMFRGFLYRHLREATAAWRISASVVASGLVASFVFAAIHPQGLFGIPALMALALAFSVLREWRGSLLAPMTAHAVNNAVVLSVTVLLF